MRIYNKYLILLAIAAGLINTLLAFLGSDDLQIYFTVNIIAYLIITLLYVHLNPRARRALSSVGVGLSAGFMVMVTMTIIKILSGR
ncbi:MAG: hypothetical protein Q8Q07_04340 [Dehalococcoidales bacterium]|nr:hypothetical protein [Dehalococcoidales bacterium]